MNRIGSNFLPARNVIAEDARGPLATKLLLQGPPGGLIKSRVHLVLSGHTHLAHPATGLHGDVVDVHQGLLSPWQLQLVGGSLMLNKSRRAARQMIPPGAAVAVRDHDRFVPSTVDGTNCQAQILRFSASPAHPGALQMVRVPVVSVDGSLYEPGEPDGLTLHYATP